MEDFGHSNSQMRWDFPKIQLAWPSLVHKAAVVEVPAEPKNFGKQAQEL